MYQSEFYRSSVKRLLDLEIRFKSKRVEKLKKECSLTSENFFSKFGLVELIYLKSVIGKNVTSYERKIKAVHERKLLKLGFSLPKFLNPDKVVFNFSNYNLSQREKFLLSLGLNFNLPNFKPSFNKFFISFELLVRKLQTLTQVENRNFEETRKRIQGLAHNLYNEVSRTSCSFPFFKKDDRDLLKSLGRRKDLVICKPDKGNGVVLLNKDDYINKMNEILSDQGKFCSTSESPFKIIFRLEDRINRFLKQLLDSKIIDQCTYNNLYSTGSSLCTLYGLPKIHKNNVPLRPILAAYNSANYKLAKYLVSKLSFLTTNEFTIKNSYEFCDQIKYVNGNGYMVSYDVKSLFTNVPLQETIEIILDKIFTSFNGTFNSFNRRDFRKLLELAVLDTHFIFNENIFKQVDGVAMGSPLGPTLANIFMCNLEQKYLNECPPHFKPIFYRRYVDDTFVIFKEKEHARMFLDFINGFHNNINFTLDTEENNSLPFLDILIFRDDYKFKTRVFRKKTFSGQSLNFFSHCSYNFKINSIKTLINRAFKICSNWKSFHVEVDFLKNFLLTIIILLAYFTKYLSNIYIIYVSPNIRYISYLNVIFTCLFRISAKGRLF